MVWTSLPLLYTQWGMWDHTPPSALAFRWQGECQQFPHGPAPAGQLRDHSRRPMAVALGLVPATSINWLPQRYP